MSRLLAMTMAVLAAIASAALAESERLGPEPVLRPACAPVPQARGCVPPRLPVGQQARPRLDYEPRTVDVDAMRREAWRNERLRRRNQ